jgi:hypothetical protein
MKLFLLDLWADLREKRLWPVAALLAAGLVAVPLVVARPARDPQPKGPDPAQQAEALPGAGVKVLAANDDAGMGSALDLFDPKDPFRPPQHVIDAEKNQGGDAKPAGGGGSGKADSGGSGGDTGGSVDTGGGAAPAPGGTAPDKPAVKTVQYAYVVDLTFRAGNRTRRIKSFRRLGFLPSESNPLLLFLGVSADLNNAVFLVDSTLEPYGEGSCKPSVDKCSLLYLGAGELHYFNTDGGDTYAVQVDQIRRVKVSGRASSSRRERRKPSGRAGQSTERRPAEPQPQPQPQPHRSFLPPVLTDLVSVATQDKAR